jgi:hypothetical protein
LVPDLSVLGEEEGSESVSLVAVVLAEEWFVGLDRGDLDSDQFDGVV